MRAAAAALLALVSVPALAQPVRQGAAAFGDWHGDAPGTVRHITVDALPRPSATASSSRGPSVVARPSGALPTVPAGFTAQIWAVGLDGPRTLRTAPNGDVFLAESGAGRIRVWRPTAGAAHPAAPSTFASRLEEPFGIAFWPADQPRYVYVAETNRVVRYPYNGGLAPTGPADIIIPSLPEGGHWTRDLAVAPDGATLYLSIGSSSNVATGMTGTVAATGSAADRGAASGDEANRAAVFSFHPDGSGLQRVASGLRNCVGLAVQPGAGALWCVTNERDGMGDDLPPDYATRVKSGEFFGWPWYYIGDHEDPRHRGERPDLRGQVTTPDVLIQPHSAPLGIAFYTGTNFPPDYVGDAFVTLHGSWNRATRTGYKLIRLRMHNGQPTGEYEDFATGMVASDNAVWARPVGVTVLHDGSLLMSEDGNGTIFRITH
ncbi:sorbosone dehydrogenase family protein [Acidisphaera sp. L21]|uniref:PQQ-dependent sugar dehydrogenase n=1 Tax=Acidisphaera sp. L21 TaxID=1641851 RepID=UPI00131E3DF7|nr:PQQ-dependent sugar dehydrogenase [Acidisphaera sp. L21]